MFLIMINTFEFHTYCLIMQSPQVLQHWIPNSKPEGSIQTL